MTCGAVSRRLYSRLNLAIKSATGQLEHGKKHLTILSIAGVRHVWFIQRLIGERASAVEMPYSLVSRDSLHMHRMPSITLPAPLSLGQASPFSIEKLSQNSRRWVDFE
jgi:hypothetical protein